MRPNTKFTVLHGAGSRSPVRTSYDPGARRPCFTGLPANDAIVAPGSIRYSERPSTAWRSGAYGPEITSLRAAQSERR
jgi:hypothetical protein